MNITPRTSLPSSRNTEQSSSPLRLLVMTVFGLSGLGCASLQPLDMNAETQVNPDSASVLPSDPAAQDIAQGVLFNPEGPGSVFESIEAAASDALIYSYLLNRSARNETGVLRGGAIFPTEGGFSYREPSRSDEGVTGRLRFSLSPTDVAHYRQFPSDAGTRVISLTGRLHVEDRKFVDQQDPLNRPIFYLTPKRRMKVYGGAESGDRAMGRIAFGVRPGATEVKVTQLALSGDPMPLASQADR